ncbi:beta-ketoacyl-[acyl-carrier-protein] synthase family protein [Thermodesulfobacteriota bacterium]
MRNACQVTLFETDLAKPVFEVKKIPGQWQRPKARTLSLAFSAADQALAEAGLLEDTGSLRVGVCLGTTVASQLNDFDYYRTYRSEGSAPMDAVKRYLSGNLSSAVAQQFSLSGPTLTIVNACSSGTDAIGAALSWLRADLCDIALAGGADELNRVPYAGFNALTLLSDDLCAPFDRNRKGMNLGEGAGMVVLEKAGSAVRRGVQSNLFCSGYGTIADAYHLTAPRPDGSGLEKAIRKAVADAGISPDTIGFINAHGTATVSNDQVEGAVLARVFGSGCRVYSTKGFTGHTLGAAGGLEAVFTALALREGWISGCVGLTETDPDIPLAPAIEPNRIQCSHALSTSLAFGGNNSALVLGRF